MGVQVPAFRIARHDVTNARFMEFVDAGGYEDPRWWAAGDWDWLRHERLSWPLFWERDGGDLVVARHVQSGEAARTLGGLRQPGRGLERTRAGVAPGFPPRPSMK